MLICLSSYTEWPRKERTLILLGPRCSRLGRKLCPDYIDLLCFFRQLPSGLTGQNSTKTCHVFESECDLKCMSKIWGILSP